MKTVKQNFFPGLRSQQVPGPSFMIWTGSVIKSCIVPGSLSVMKTLSIHEYEGCCIVFNWTETVGESICYFNGKERIDGDIHPRENGALEV